MWTLAQPGLAPGVRRVSIFRRFTPASTASPKNSLQAFPHLRIAGFTRVAIVRQKVIRADRAGLIVHAEARKQHLRQSRVGIVGAERRLVLYREQDNRCRLGPPKEFLQRTLVLFRNPDRVCGRALRGRKNAIQARCVNLTTNKLRLIPSETTGPIEVFGLGPVTALANDF
jgi:hypothetical protein